MKKKKGKHALKVEVGKTVDLKVKPVPTKQTTAIAKSKGKGPIKDDAAGRVTALKKGKTKITIKLGKHKIVVQGTVK